MFGIVVWYYRINMFRMLLPLSFDSQGEENMDFLQKYMKEYWKPFSVAVVFLMLEALCDLALPTIMSDIIDVGVAAKRMDVVVRLGSFMVLITALGAVMASIRNILSSQVSFKFGAELRLDLFKKIQSLSLDKIGSFERASLVTRLTNDVTQVQNFVNGLMRIFVRAPLLCIGSVIMAVRLNPHLAVVLLVVVPIVGLLIVFNMAVGFPRFIRVQNALDQVNLVIREYLSGVRVVKAFNRFDYEVQKFAGTNAEYQSRSIHAMRTMVMFSPAIMLTMNAGIIAVIWLGGLRVQSGQMQVGHIIAFIHYMTQILFSLMLISMVFLTFVRAKASVLRIGEVFRQVNTMTWKEDVECSSDPAAKGRVDFENVSFSYEGTAGAPAVKHLTFTCMPGETVGIIGATGSGKSSLVSLIPRFYDADSGTVKVNGVDVRQIDPRKLRESIAFVPQQTVLFTGTIIDNIKWGKEDASTEEIEKAAKTAQAHEFITSLPDGYQTGLGQHGVNLSGGQKQRVSIARALASQPQILILDDCTSAVDSATEAKIKEALKTYAKDLTCLVIAQRITSVMDADKIIVLDRGEIVGLGSHIDLLQNCRVYQEIYRSQAGKEVREDGEPG